MNDTDTELSLMESIGEAEHSQARITQRELASRAGLSLGMTNALLRRLAGSGWVKLTRLSTKNVRYALTPEGMGEIARRTAGYFRRAARNADRYRARLELFIMEAKRAGASTLLLAGASELDFLLEYICERHGMVFVKTTDYARARSTGRRPGVALLYAESRDEAGQEQVAPGAACLRDIINQPDEPVMKILE
jgi:DNA-binding MarR family transcriptional regulator